VSALEPLGRELWVAAVPLRFAGFHVGRNMAVARLRGGELVVHSPAPLTAGLRHELEDLGEVRFVVPASRLHGHVFMEQYRDAYPNVELFAAPGLERRRRDLAFAGTLGDAADRRWSADLDQAIFHGHRMWTEIVFLHRPSRTLILGDLCWNVTERMTFGTRLWAGWRRGVHPTPGFRAGIRDKVAVRRSLERILAWDFERIVPGHGEVVTSGGHEAFAAAYSRLLRGGRER
jgi:glyoxylase-like metal-dependent hydrolase (beta-lactamase superfamily II)